MGGKHYTILGWVIWKFASREARRKLRENRAKIGAAGVVLLVVVGGILAARGDDG